MTDPTDAEFEPDDQDYDSEEVCVICGIHFEPDPNSCAQFVCDECAYGDGIL